MRQMAWLNACRAALRPLALKPCSTFNYCVQRWRGESPVNNYYKVLGLRPNASQSQIKSAYYQLSKLYHPGAAKNLPNSEEMFARLSVAYEVLGDPHKRALYDREHHPSASFRPVSDDDIEYKNFLRHKGSFSLRRGATAATTRRPGLEFDEFYKKHYGNSMKDNWQVKKSSHYRQHLPLESNKASTVFGLVLTACIVCALFFMK